MRRFAIIVLVAVIVCASPIAGQVTIKKQSPAPTSAASGQEMYITYCAACHGSDGKGNGPAAPALRTSPTDLTSLAAKNKGQFPTNRVQASIKLGVVTAHGTSEMPVWGALLKDVGGTSKTSQGEIQLRVYNLTNYVKSLQK